MAKSYEEIRKAVEERLKERGIVVPKTDILGAIKHGLSQSLPGLGVSAAIGYKSDFNPDTGAEKGIALISEFLPDIAGLVATGGASAIGSIGKAAGRGALKSLVKSSIKPAYKNILKGIAKETGKKVGRTAGKEGVSRLTATTALRNFIPKGVGKAFAKEGLGTAVEGGLYGIYEGLKSPLRQQINEGKVDFTKTLRDIGVTTALGGGIGGALGLAGAGVQGVASKLYNKMAPLSSRGKPSVIERAYNLAMDDAGKIKNIRKALNNIDENRTNLSKAFAKLERVKSPDVIKRVRGKISRLETQYKVKQSALKDAIDKSGLSRDELITSLSYVAPNRTTGMLDDKIIMDATKTQNFENIKSLLFGKRLKEFGIYDDQIKDLANRKGSKFLERTLNIGNYIDRVEQETGARLMEPFRNSIKASNTASSVSNRLNNLIRPIEKNIKKHNIDPSKISDIVEGTYKGVPTETEIGIANAVRKYYDEALTELQKLNPDVKGLKNYVNRARSVYLKTGVKPGNIEFKKQMGKYNFSPEHSRILEEVPELESLIMERDIVKLMDKYNRGLTRNILEKNGFTQFQNTKDMLRLRGYDKEIKNLDDWYATSIGMNRNEFNKLSKTALLNESKDYIRNAVADYTMIEQPAYRKALKKISEMMYESWVGLRPRNWIKNFFQPYLVGGVELGQKNVLKAEMDIAKGKYKDLIDEVLPTLKQTSLDMSEMSVKRTNPASLAEKIVRAPGKAGMYVFDKIMDTRNRKVVFLAGYKKAKQQGFTDDVLKTLLPSQKRYVREILLNEGEETAAKAFGRIMSDRVNYIYNILDKPMLLRSEIGQYIPFTTWSRNQWNLFYNDLINNQGITASQRALVPLMQIFLLGKLTGLDIMDFTPASTLLGAFNMNVAPAIQNISEQLGQGNVLKAGRDAATVLPLYNALKKAGIVN